MNTDKCTQINTHAKSETNTHTLTDIEKLKHKMKSKQKSGS